MMFKGNKVYALVDESENLLTRNGLATIKYQLHQDQEYRARADAVTEIDESLLNKKAAGDRMDMNSPRTAELIAPDAAHVGKGITVYTDGACEGNPGPAGIGITLLHHDQRKEISRFIGSGTNNIAELTAILVALKEIRNPRLPVFLHTDSAYAYGVLLGGWKAKKNHELIKEIKEEMARFANLKIIKVKGHAGHEENERADQLARQAISEMRQH